MQFIVYKDGGIYQGECKENKRDGKGRFFYKNGPVYYGEWKNDKQHGKGMMIYQELDFFYEGEWCNGKLKRETKENIYVKR